VNFLKKIRDTTDDLDSAGNTTAAIGKGFAIGSACLVALSLFGAFVTKTSLKEINVLTPIILTGLLIGAMMPYLFSALTMMAVGNAAEVMVQAVREDFNAKAGTNEAPDSNKCIQIATNKSLSQMFLPGAIIIFVPIILGVLFGPNAVAGYLMGVIVSGIQMAISASNSGGAWDNCKKSIKNYGLPMTGKEKLIAERNEIRQRIEKIEKILEGEGVIENREQLLEELETIKIRKEDKEREIKAIEAHPQNPNNTEEILVREKMKAYRSAEKASIIGDTVGDPMKDTSGPSLNILIKLSSIISVVFGTLFVNTSYLLK